MNPRRPIPLSTSACHLSRLRAAVGCGVFASAPTGPVPVVAVAAVVSVHVSSCRLTAISRERELLAKASMPTNGSAKNPSVSDPKKDVPLNPYAQDKNKKRSNPYAKASTGVNEQKTKASVENTNSGSRPSKAPRSISLGSLVGKKTNQTRNEADPVAKLLHQSESDTYTGKAKTNMASTIKSNAEVQCPVCELSSEKVSLD